MEKLPLILTVFVIMPRFAATAPTLVKPRRGRFGASIRASVALFALVGSVALFPGAQLVRAQTFKVLYTFTGHADGADPGGLTLGRAGELYGVTNVGGNPGCHSGCGVIFELSPEGSNWHFNVLHTFQDGPDGAFPFAPMVFGPDGSLYGTTPVGGTAPGIASNGCRGGCGTIFRLKPLTPSCGRSCSWSETVLYRFPGGSYGLAPGFDAPLIFDQAGNLYGTTQIGGYMGGGCGDINGCGVVFELTPSNGAWVEHVLHAFGEGGVGLSPTAGVIFDDQGNLYGTTTGSNVFQLIPSGSGWTYNNLMETGDTITAGVIFDESGNLYGATSDGGPLEGGTAFKMMPKVSGAVWETQMIFGFALGPGGQPYFPGPGLTLVADVSGNLYGTTTADGAYGLGTVFKLSPTGQDLWSYTYTDLHDFTGGSDGDNPSASLVRDDDGNLYGTAEFGGPNVIGGSIKGCQGRGCGVVFEITP